MSGPETPPSRPVARTRIWTRPYILLCSAQMLAYADSGLLTPVLPLYVVSLGGSELVVGLVLASFSVASFLLRPFVGYLADRWSVLGVLSLGMLLLAVSGLALLIPVLAALFVANALRGVGWGGLNTGGGTVLASVAPPARRGEAASYYNTFQSATSTVTPSIALLLLAVPGVDFTTVILIAVGSSMTGAALTRAIPANVVQRQDGSPARPTVQRAGVDRFLERSVWLPTVLLATVTVAHPATRGFVPLFAVQIGIPVELVAWYFLASGATALFGRVLLGRLSDRFGRGPMLVVGYLFLAGGLVVFALADGLTTLLVAGVLHGVGDAILIPGNLALAIDLGDPSRRGAAMATFTLAFQVGVAVGAALAGVIIELAGYRPMYLAIASFSLIGLTLVAVRWGSLPRRTRVQ